MNVIVVKQPTKCMYHFGMINILFPLYGLLPSIDSKTWLVLSKVPYHNHTLFDMAYIVYQMVITIEGTSLMLGEMLGS